MEEKIKQIIATVNEEILNYDGDNLFEAGILDSLQTVDLISELEDELEIEIDAAYVIEENFKTKGSIIDLVLRIINGEID